MGKARKETPTEAFENLRQAFDVLKANHSDPWCWHEYLNEEPESSSDEDEDPEMDQLKPRKRTHMDRLKQHLLTCVTELNRCAQAADTCYFHMCCSPEQMKPCVILLGTAGDIDADMLASGDASPQKIMAMLQQRLDEAHEKITLLEAEVEELKAKLCETMAESKDRWQRWQRSAMLAEDTITKLDSMTRAFNNLTATKQQLEADYKDLYVRHIRASRMMIHKGRQMLRDNVFKVGKKENLFYTFQGFICTLQKEKEERIRREHEMQRDRVEFALRNEVKFLLAEAWRHRSTVQRLVSEANRLKNDRRNFALRIMHKNRRPYEVLEYCLWIWEMWQPIRAQIRLEKALEAEQTRHDSCIQQLVQTSQQLPPLAHRIDELQEDLLAEQVAHDVSKRELTEKASRMFGIFVEHLRVHRIQELAVLHRIHMVDIEDKKERIAVLEREIAEDKHIHALKGMVVDLESNLRKALDRRKQRAFVVPQKSDSKCPHCARENMYRSWRGAAQDSVASEVDPTSPVSTGEQPPMLRTSTSLGALNAKGISPRLLLPVERAGRLAALQAPGEKRATYSAVWR